MKICSATKQWRPSATSSFAHLGAEWLSDWKSGHRWRSGIIPIIFLAIVSCVAFCWNLMEWRGLENSQMIFISWGYGALVALLALPILLRGAWMASNQWLLRVLSLEFWAMSGIAVGLFLEWPWKIEKLIPLAAMGLLVMILRFLEAWAWHRNLITTPFDDSTYWTENRRSAVERNHLLIGLIGFVFIFGMALADYFMTGVFILSVTPFFAMCICCIPFQTWVQTRIAKRSAEEGWLFRSNQFFKTLRRFKLTILHSTGVLTQGQLEVADSWIDPEAGWSADDIRDILLQLIRSRAHPISRAIEDHFTQPRRFIFEPEDIEHYPHLGLRAAFRDPQRARIQIVFGTVSWHRSLQSDMVDQGRQKLKSWLDDGHHMSLLSINQTVVAGFAFRDKPVSDLKEGLADLKQMGVSATALSSSCRAVTVDPNLRESQWDLFPIERKLQFKRWTERQPAALEVKSFWDAPSVLSLPVVGFRRLDAEPLDQESLTLFSGKLAALPAAIRASQSFHRASMAWPPCVALGTLITLGLPSLSVAASVVFLTFAGCLSWTMKVALK